MNKKSIVNTIACAALLAATACSDDLSNDGHGSSDREVNFTATLRESSTVTTRAIGDTEKGEVMVLPYINNITIRKVQPSTTDVTLNPYNVKNGNKGLLEFNEGIGNSLKWDDTHLNEDVDFYGWTTPGGVDIVESGNTGTVNFVTGNTYNSGADAKDKLNGQSVTPLEVFISSSSLGNNYSKSPSVSFPFTHLVCKISFFVRNWDNQNITDGSDIQFHFLSIPNEWKVEQTTSGSLENKSAFRITEPVNASCPDLAFSFGQLQKEVISGRTYFTVYLPPLVGEYAFDKAGGFCVTYGGKEYYGTLDAITLDSPKGTAKKKELAAGEHISIQLDLSINYGVGIGAWIVDWQGPNNDDIIYSNPNRGIYSTEGFECLVDYLDDPNVGLSDSLYIEVGGVKTIRLYNDITITPDLAVKLKTATLNGITFDGQGHTITLPDGASGLFNVIGETSATTVVQNLYIKGGEITANGMLANSVSNATISGCHVLEGSVKPSSSGVAGGLFGSVEAGTTIEYCSSMASVEGTTAGGLIGEVVTGVSSVNIEGCYAQCAVTGVTHAGGLIGNMQSGILRWSYFYSDGTIGTVTGAGSRGALVGAALNNSTISECFWAKFDGLDAISSGSFTDCFSFTNNKFSPAITIGSQSYSTLMEVLTALTGEKWVWVYGKDYPVLEKI